MTSYGTDNPAPVESDKAMLPEEMLKFYDIPNYVLQDGKHTLADAIQALVDKACVAELTPFTNLQSEIEATHFEPCNFCGQLSHHCDCASPLIWVEKTAQDRINQLGAKDE